MSQRENTKDVRETRSRRSGVRRESAHQPASSRNRWARQFSVQQREAGQEKDSEDGVGVKRNQGTGGLPRGPEEGSHLAGRLRHGEADLLEGPAAFAGFPGRNGCQGGPSSRAGKFKKAETRGYVAKASTLDADQRTSLFHNCRDTRRRPS